MNRKLKALLVEKGIKQTDIAKALGISVSAVCMALGGRCESRPVKLKTAELLQIDIQKLERFWRRAA